MLAALSIRGIVLIDRLDLEFGSGLCVLSGETGAGKSILLDSLDLALGGRGDASLVRKGDDKGSVTAVFEPPAGCGVQKILARHGLEDEGQLVLRRVQFADGRSRAYVNDTPVNVTALREIGCAIAEIHGQHDARLLGDYSIHRQLLDAYGGLDDLCGQAGDAWELWAAARTKLEDEELAAEKALRDAEYLRHAADELRRLSPQPDEEQKLAGTRQLMMNAEKISAGLTEAHEALGGSSGWEERASRAMKTLERQKEGGEILARSVAALERALVEAGEARNALEEAISAARFDPKTLEEAEERLFALRAAARKHRVGVEALPDLMAEMEEQLAGIETAEHRIGELREACAAAEKTYGALAGELSQKRMAAASGLDEAVAGELEPLKLGRAVFVTKVESDDNLAGPYGNDKIRFLAATNPGADPGPLGKIASGGELSRFMLALKVVLAAKDNMPTLVFDEIDAGVGGAVADAVGVRLKKLAEAAQVLVVTHSPQVAACGSEHFLVLKSDEEENLPDVSVSALRDGERREEIARMLSGAQVTDEARAAAARLLEQGA